MYFLIIIGIFIGLILVYLITIIFFPGIKAKEQPLFSGNRLPLLKRSVMIKSEENEI